MAISKGKSRNHCSANVRTAFKSAYHTQLGIECYSEHEAMILYNINLIRQSNERKYALSKVNAYYRFPREIYEEEPSMEQPIERTSIYANPRIHFTPIRKCNGAVKKGHFRVSSRNIRMAFNSLKNGPNITVVKRSEAKLNFGVSALMSKRLTHHRRVLTKMETSIA